MQARFRPSLETLDDRLNLSTASLVDLGVVVYASREVAATLEGHECLVFVLGGIPSSDPVPTDYVFGTELPPGANGPIRHRMFAIVDRTQFGDDAEEARRDLVTTLSYDLDRPGSTPQIQGTLLIARQQALRSADEEMVLSGVPVAEQDRVGPFFEFTSNRLQTSAEDGRKYKMLVAPLILELDAADGAGISTILQRLANPSIPYEGTHALYQDIFIPAADPFAFTRDAKSSGM